ncbi:hypothetical protein DAEQUDRAFT_232390 [Daedalea quercina L-15889]|uniref:Uncharacterized protein n=1 Tax=Daedalea quercina L-15889 TaxID=1314783 RepID=A0A165QUA3_9APHY|nr:hypothetical protein DAEQUDRAFT_232390 [Daedalea quercina L-15889]
MTASIHRPASPAVKTEATSRMEAILNACNTSAGQGHNPRSAIPPHMRSASGQAGPIAISTPNVKGKGAVAVDSGGAGASAPSSVAAPTVQDHQPQHRPNETSTMNASGIAQLRSPQSDQRYSGQPPQEDRHVPFTPQPVASISISAVAAPPPAPLDVDAAIPDDTSEFHFNSDDDAFLAEVDLGEEGIGGPIDFDEGVGRLEAGEESREEVHDSRCIGQPQPQYAASGPSSTSHRYQTTTTNNHHAPQSSRHTSTTPIAQSPPTMGGFHFPGASSVRPPVQIA